MFPNDSKRSLTIVHRSIQTSYPLWVAVFFLAAVFLMGGGARADIQSLVILRPLAAICIGIAIWGLTREQLAAVRLPLALAAMVPLIMILQLVPLPPAIWTNLPGRDIYAQAASLAGIEQPWRPISLVPYRTWNSLFACLIPFAAILLVARLDREQRFVLLPVLVGLGLISGVLGLAQAIGPRNGPLYLYEITNNGSAVGLFANRNHQAALLACLFPMLAVYASFDHQSAQHARLKSVLCVNAALFVLPLLLVTGSRAGLVLGVIGLLAAALLYRHPRRYRQKGPSSRRFYLRYVVGGIAALALGGVTALLSRAQAVDRLLMKDETEELRLQLLQPIWQMIETYFPFGIGFGTFQDVYRVHEPFELLSVAYVNHAHNDLLEFVLEGGVAAAVALLIGIVAWVIGVARLRVGGGEPGRSILLGRLGAAITLILGIASIVDYPLRVPSASAIFVIAVIWMALGTRSSISREIHEEAVE